MHFRFDTLKYLQHINIWEHVLDGLNRARVRRYTDKLLYGQNLLAHHYRKYGKSLSFGYICPSCSFTVYMLWQRNNTRRVRYALRASIPITKWHVVARANMPKGILPLLLAMVEVKICPCFFKIFLDINLNKIYCLW